MKKAVILTKDLRTVALALPAPDEARKELHAVRVESNGELLRMVATNGRVMFCIVAKSKGGAGDIFSVNVPSAAVDSMLKLTKMAELILTFDEFANEVSLSDGRETIKSAVVTNSYPAYTRAFCNVKLDRPMAPSHYDPKYLTLLKKAAGLYTRQKNHEAQMYQFGEHTGVYLHDKFLALVMPMTPFNPPANTALSEDFLREIL